MLWRGRKTSSSIMHDRVPSSEEYTRQTPNGMPMKGLIGMRHDRLLRQQACGRNEACPRAVLLSVCGWNEARLRGFLLSSKEATRSCLIPMRKAHGHACTPTNTHTHTHTNKHAHSRARTRTRTHTRMHPQTQTYAWHLEWRGRRKVVGHHRALHSCSQTAATGVAALQG